jgi:hypothetical protein
VPLVQPKQVKSHNRFYSGSASLPVLSLGGATVMLVTAVPATTGDVLKAGTFVQANPTARLPAGLNISYCVVENDNVVTVGLTANISIGAQTINWVFCAPG